jgi:hypothetical protein
MKSIITLFIAGTIATQSFADFAPGKLSISFSGNRDIQVVVDNNRYSDYDNSVLINNLSAGYHSVQIYEGNTRKERWNQKRSNLLYSSSVYVRPAYQVNILVNKFGQAQITEQFIRYNNHGRDDRYGDDRYGDDRYGDDRYGDDRYGDDRNDRNDRWGDDDRYDRRDDRSYGYHQSMAEPDFSVLMSNLRREQFEDRRLSAAMNVMNSTWFSTAQLRQMLKLFSFENRRLELAKIAYGKTVDQQNFNNLYDLFNDSSRRDLDENCRHR